MRQLDEKVLTIEYVGIVQAPEPPKTFTVMHRATLIPSFYERALNGLSSCYVYIPEVLRYNAELGGSLEAMVIWDQGYYNTILTEQ